MSEDRFYCRECSATFDDHAAAVDHAFDEHVNVKDLIVDRHNREVDHGR